MKKQIVLLFAAVLSAAACFGRGAQPAGFTDDLDAACIEAGRTGRRVFAVFSGSDWCGWCIRFEREILSKKAFRDEAAKKFVLAFVDSPEDQNLLSAKARKRNPALVERYGIRGFPTVLVLDSAGKVLTQTGYRKGGVKPYLAHLDELAETLSPPAAEPAEKPRVLAHRGGRAEYGDNALGAFRQSLAYGITGYETDVRATSDGELVLMHDADVSRTTTGTGRVDRLTFAAFKALALKGNGENPPALADVLELFKGDARLWVEFEMKGCAPLSAEAYCRKLHDAVAAKMAPGTYAFTSFDANLVATMNRLFPGGKTSLIAGRVMDEKLIETAKAIGANGVSPLLRSKGTNGVVAVTSAELVAKAHAAGMRVALWMVEDGAAYALAKQLGADTITSDNPVLVQDAARVAAVSAAHPAFVKATYPVAKLQQDGYDWFKRHAKIMADKAKMNPELVFVGDSITHFWAGRTSIGAADDPDTTQRWKDAFGKYRTLNLGFGWDRTGNVFKRIEMGELDGISPQVIVIHIGGNNFTTTANYKGDGPEDVAEANCALVEKIHLLHPRAHLVVMAVFPFGAKPGPGHRSQHPVCNSILKRELDGLEYVTFIDLTDKQLDKDGVYPDALARDHVHPTDAGYAIWAQALAPVLEKHLGKR